MDISLFLAKIIGWVLVIIGLATFVKREFMRDVIKDFISHSSIILISATMNIILALLIVLSHNVWEASWKVVITILGYLMLLRGLLHVFIPEWVRKMAKKFLNNDLFVYSGVISFVVGIYLLYHG